MTNIRLATLEAVPGTQDFARSLSETLALQAPLLATAIVFDEMYGKDCDAAAQSLAFLQLHIFTHLVGKIQKTIRPFIRLRREIYSHLPEPSEDEEIVIAKTPIIMRETKLPHLEAIPSLSSFRYHLCGIIDALDDVKEYALALDATYGMDDEAASDAISSLQVHLFFHLPYHLKKLRRPFIRLNHEIYAKLDEEPYVEDD